MSRKMNARIIKATKGVSITKGENFQGQQEDKTLTGSYKHGLLDPPYSLTDLYDMTEYSTILSQCIEAYRRNITGFGPEIQFTVDEKENPTMTAEKGQLESFIKYFSFEKSFEDVFGEGISDRERTGNGYVEIIREGTGKVAGGNRLDPRTMRVTKLSDPTDVTYNMDGKSFKRKKKFRRFAQALSNGEYIWFKELGDPRFMDCYSGEYTAGHNGNNEATEILHLKVGEDAYGVPRWIAQIIHMYGARKAEELNYNYFINGRHTPLAVMVQNGILTEDSFNKIQEYANGVQGTDNAHKFLLLEVEGIETGIVPGENKPTPAKIELKSLADMLQSDALFLEYDESSRKKVQSAFRLPDLYVGRSMDYNRATADKIRQVTEEQVFEPERKSLEFVINQLLLNDYQLKLARINFKTPDISDPNDQAKLIDVVAKYGGITPNDLRPKASEVLGRPLDPLKGDGVDIPITLAPKAPTTPLGGPDKPLPIDKPTDKPVEDVQKVIGLLKDIRDEVEEYGKTPPTA